MKNILRSKTLTASLSAGADAVYAQIADADQLSRWHSGFCRSLRRDGGTLTAETPKGPVTVTLIREDRARVLDLIVRHPEGFEITTALRVLPSGEGCELTLTLLRPEGLPENAFHEQIRWAETALRNLRKTPAPLPSASAGVSAAPAGDIGSVEAAPGTADATPPEPLIPPSGRKLFVGNLPFDWKEDQLRAHFADAGEVTAVAIARFRRRGGRSRGFGFVEMATEDQAQAAIVKLHESLAGTRKILVRVSRSQENRQEEKDESPAGSAPAETAAPAAPAPRTRPPQRSRGPGRRPRPEPRRPSRRPMRIESAHHDDTAPEIVNNSGYEYFPRRSQTPESTEG